MGDALAPACGEEGTSGEVLASVSEAAAYDVAPRPEGHDVRRIQHAVQAIRTAYFGTGGVYGSRVSAVQGLESGLEEIPQDSDFLIDLIVSAIGLASGGLGGFLMSRLLTAMGAVLDRGAHPHNAIGPAPPQPELASRVVSGLAKLAVAKVEGKAKDAVVTKVKSALAATGKGPSVAAFINAQVDGLEISSNEKNLTWDSAEIEHAFLQMPDGVAAAQAMLKEVSDSVSRARLEQTVATLGAWSKAYRQGARGLLTLEVERDEASGRLVVIGSKIAGMKPGTAQTLSARGATVKDVVTASEAMEVKVTIGGGVGFTLPSGLRGEPRLPPDHIVPSFFREHARRYFGMGPNADPQLAASIAVHRDLLGASL